MGVGVQIISVVGAMPLHAGHNERPIFSELGCTHTCLPPPSPQVLMHRFPPAYCPAIVGCILSLVQVLPRDLLPSTSGTNTPHIKNAAMALNAWRVRRGVGLDITALPGVELLTARERELCASARLLPVHYLSLKDVMMREAEEAPITRQDVSGAALTRVCSCLGDMCTSASMFGVCVMFLVAPKPFVESTSEIFRAFAMLPHPVCVY